MDLFYPLQLFANTLVSNWLGLGTGSYLGRALNFFVYDSLKISILLLIINFIMAITRYYFPINQVRNWLALRRWYGLDYLIAAILGVVTPFCSCSSIPLFIGFLSAGIPLGVTFSFLIASPLVNESSLILFPALFGWRTTIIYNVSGLVVAIIGGVLIQKLKLEKYVNSELLKTNTQNKAIIRKRLQKQSLQKLMASWWFDGYTLSKKILPYVILGVAVGAIIHGYVPTNFFEKYMVIKAWWSVPLATLLGVPLYANSISVIPVIESLIGKGIPLGTALAFMTATVTLSIPEALMLNKAMKWPLLAAFFGITIVGIILIGYLFNYLYL